MSDELLLDMLSEPAKPTDSLHVPVGQTAMQMSIRFIELVQAHSDLIGMIWVDRIRIIIVDTLEGKTFHIDCLLCDQTD